MGLLFKTSEGVVIGFQFFAWSGLRQNFGRKQLRIRETRRENWQIRRVNSSTGVGLELEYSDIYIRMRVGAKKDSKDFLEEKPLPIKLVVTRNAISY